MSSVPGRAPEESPPDQPSLVADPGVLHGALMQAPMPVCMVRGPEHVFTFANPPYLALLGGREILGKRVVDVLPDIAAQGIIDLLDGVYRTGTPFVGNAIGIDADWLGNGKVERRYYDFIYHPVTEQEQPAGILVLATEVTAQVVARQATEEVHARRTAHLQAIAQAGVAINAAGNLDGALAELTERARIIIGAHQAVTSLTSGPDWSQAINAVSMSDKYARWKDYAEKPNGSGIYAWVCEQNRPVRMTQAELEVHPRWKGFGKHKDKHPPMNGWLAVPLVSQDGHNLGLVQLSDKYDGDFDEADVAVLVQLAQMGSVAVQNARLLEQAKAHAEAQARRAQLAQLHGEVGAALTKSASRREMLQRCAEAMVTALDAAFARIWTLNDAGDTLELQASAGQYTHIDGPHARVPVGAFKIGRIASSGRPHLSNDVLNDPEIGDPEWAAREGMVSFAGYPLIIEGRVVGVMALFARKPLGEDVLQALAPVADSVAVGIGKKRLEDAQRQSEERFRSVVEATAAVVWRTNAQGEVVEDSPSWRQFTGQSLEEWLSGEGWTKALHPADQQRALDVWQDSVAKGRPYEVEYRLRHHSGQYRDVLVRGTPIFEADGRIREWVGANVDVTHVREAERLLAHQTQVLKTLTDNATLGLFLMDAQHKCTFMNPAAEKLTGLTFEQVRAADKPLHYLIHHTRPDGAHFPMEECAIDRALPTRAREQGEDTFVRPDGTFYPVAFTASPIVHEDGPAGTVIEVRDITEARRAEAERERLIAALQRTNAELDQFAYVASHDLKAPLRGIASLSQWLEEDEGAQLGEKGREHLHLLRGRVHRMEALIDGILDYSRAGRARHKMEPVDVGRLLTEVVDLLGAAPGVVHVQPGLPVVQSERVPLQQVFMNLVGNALKHAACEGAKVEVSARRESRGWRFSVRDNGPGIAPQYQEKIWLIFQTLKPRDRVEGTGIGLSVVKKIVESRGGLAWVESREGEGACFHFTWRDQPPEELA